MSPAGSRCYGVADIGQPTFQRRTESYDSGGCDYHRASLCLVVVTAIRAGFSLARFPLFPNDLGD